MHICIHICIDIYKARNRNERRKRLQRIYLNLFKVCGGKIFKLLWFTEGIFSFVRQDTAYTFHCTELIQCAVCTTFNGLPDRCGAPRSEQCDIISLTFLEGIHIPGSLLQTETNSFWGPFHARTRLI